MSCISDQGEAKAVRWSQRTGPRVSLEAAARTISPARTNRRQTGLGTVCCGGKARPTGGAATRPSLLLPPDDSGPVSTTAGIQAEQSPPPSPTRTPHLVETLSQLLCDWIQRNGFSYLTPRSKLITFPLLRTCHQRVL